MQKTEITNSECIFIGEVIEINNSDLTFKIKVIESLDGGDAIGNLYVGRNWKFCSPYVEKKGKWIVYGNIEDGFLRLNMCGISRSFDNPIVDVMIPPPSTEKNELERKKEFEKFRTKNIKIALSKLELEITALRKIRDQK